LTAGYCSQFGTAAKMEELLRYVSEPTSRFVAPIVAPGHGDRCQTSCPDCLRDCSNLAWHNILDWRLAIDLSRLAVDVSASVIFSAPHWQSLVVSAPPPYFRALGWNATVLAGLPAARSGRRGEFIVHPLWAGDHPTEVRAHSEALASGITEPRRKTSFELVRRPF
jgi:hypothetical protein